MQFYAIADEYTCWGAIDSDGGVMELIAVGVGKGNIENGGCVWKVKNDDVVIGMEGGREKEYLG